MKIVPLHPAILLLICLLAATTSAQTTTSAALSPTTATATPTTSTAPATTSSMAAALSRQFQADPAPFQTSEEWQKLWRLVGSGTNLGIDTTVTLPREVQQVALKALETVLLDDLKANKPPQYDERHFVHMAHFIISDKELYVFAYANLANHAMLRDSKVGQLMFRYLPYDEGAWKQLPVPFRMFAYYMKQDFKNCAEMCRLVMEDPLIPPELKQQARALQLSSLFQLDDPTACDKIKATNPNDFALSDTKQMVLSLQDRCTSTATTTSP